MATSIQRSASTVSIELYSPKDNFSMDADAEMCRMFGSLNLRAWVPEEGKQLIAEEIQPMPQPEEDAQMSMEAEITEMTDGEGNVQFIETTPAKPTETPIEGCALLQMLCAHYAPALSRVHRDCSTRDPDFNLLETILAHREAFVAFPFGHRSCSAALTKVAFEIERRHNAAMPYPAAEDDLDTAIALHNEAWLMSGWYST